MIKKIHYKKKPVHKGAIRISKRGTISEIEKFKKLSYNMPRQQLIEHIAITKPDAPTHKIALNVLKILHGMNNEDIIKAVNKIRLNRNLIRDLRVYYHGEMPSEQIMNKYNINDKNIIDELAMRDTYELPSSIGYSHRIHEIGSVDREKTGIKFNESKGQRPFSTVLSHQYREFVESLAKNQSIPTNHKQVLLKMYLMDIAEERPEHAAVISYIINGGNPNDPFDNMMAKFNGHFGKNGTKVDFIENMKRYQMFKASNPQFKAQRIKDIESEKNKIENNKQRIAQLSALSHEESKKLKHLRDSNAIDYIKDDMIRTKSLSQELDKFDPNLVGKSDDSYEIDRHRRVKKIIIKRKPKRIIKKCRCK